MFTESRPRSSSASHQPVDERGKPGAPADRRAGAVPRQVDRDHPVSRGEGLDLWCPGFEPKSDTVDQHHRLALAGIDVGGAVQRARSRPGWKRHVRDPSGPGSGRRCDDAADRRPTHRGRPRSRRRRVHRGWRIGSSDSAIGALRRSCPSAGSSPARWPDHVCWRRRGTTSRRPPRDSGCRSEACGVLRKSIAIARFHPLEYYMMVYQSRRRTQSRRVRTRQ